MVARKHGCLLTQQVGHGHRRAFGERIKRLLTHRDHDSRRCAGKRVEVGAVADALRSLSEGVLPGTRCTPP